MNHQSNSIRSFFLEITDQSISSFRKDPSIPKRSELLFGRPGLQWKYWNPDPASKRVPSTFHLRASFVLYPHCSINQGLLLSTWWLWVYPDQALAGSRISIPGFFGTGFPNILDPGILLKPFGIYIFALFACQIGSFSSIFIITFVIIITLLLITIKSMSEIM